MKIWNTFGTEHSMNLVLIGRFKEIRNAEDAMRSIERLTTFVANEEPPPSSTAPREQHRFSEAMRELLSSERLYSFAPEELEQFSYDVSVDRDKSQISLRTDEVDISAFLKLLVEKGARVEVYSAHDYPDGKD